jgi:hypothetical protein
MRLGAAGCSTRAAGDGLSTRCGAGRGLLELASKIPALKSESSNSFGIAVGRASSNGGATVCTAISVAAISSVACARASLGLRRPPVRPRGRTAASETDLLRVFFLCCAIFLFPGI